MPEVLRDQFLEVLERFIKFHGGDERKVAEFLRTAIPTVHRWRNKVTTPHPALMRAAIKAMEEAMFEP